MTFQLDTWNSGLERIRGTECVSLRLHSQHSGITRTGQIMAQASARPRTRVRRGRQSISSLVKEVESIVYQGAIVGGR